MSEWRGGGKESVKIINTLISETEREGEGGREKSKTGGKNEFMKLLHIPIFSTPQTAAPPCLGV